MKIRHLVFTLVAFGATTTASAQRDSGQVFALDRVVAVVGKKAITMYELQDRVNELNQQRLAAQQPALTGDTLTIMHRVLSDMIDEEIFTQKAQEMKLTVPDAEVNADADQQMAKARSQFKTETEFRSAIKEAGYATPEALRAHFVKQARDSRMQQAAMDTLKKLGLMPTISVSDKDVQQAFDSLKANLQERGPTVTFRQIVMKPTASDSAKAKARALADSVRSLIAAGASWDSLALRFSADSGSQYGPDSSSAHRGGDLGWMRRGATTERFDSVMFNIQIGQLSPVFETEFGFHFLKVERLRPGEARARHILIVPKLYPDDVVRAKAKVDSLKTLLEKGANFDSLSTIYHDAQAHRRKVDNWPVSELPDEYKDALRGMKVNEYSSIFEVTPAEGGLNKAAVLQVLSRNESGAYTIEEVRSQMRSRLQQAGSIRRTIDMLKKQTYVSIRLPKPSPVSIKQ